MSPTKNQITSIDPTRDSPLKNDNVNGLPRLTGESKDCDIQAWLHVCQQELEQSGKNQDIRLYDTIFSFKDGQEKANSTVDGAQPAWYPELKSRGLFSELLQKSLGGKRHKCALVICYSGNWVRMTAEERENQIFHASVAFILARKDGKQGKVMIY
jgi:hypothetical protein